MALTVRLIGIRWQQGNYHVSGVVNPGWDANALMHHDQRFRRIDLGAGYMDALAVLTHADVIEIEASQKPIAPMLDQSLSGATFLIAHIEEWESALE